MQAGNKYELPFWEKGELCIGIDEAGRGPIAGPVVVAGVVLPPNFSYDGIYDSKKVSEKNREKLYDIIVEQASAYIICVVDHSEIDAGNIYQVVRKAMIDCANTVNANICGVLTDAMPFELNRKEVISLIKGDQKSISIAAASILAKVTRDRIMCEYDKLYPGYEFAKHKGYYTKLHKECIERLGPCPIHRITFEPIKSMIQPKLF